MTIDTIDAAILAHRAWVARFQAALTGKNDEVFDLAKARDDTICDLGRWLASEAALNLLGRDSLQRIVVLHGMFHEIAGEIGSKINEHQPAAETRALLREFANLSEQLVGLLNLAKNRA